MTTDSEANSINFKSFSAMLRNKLSSQVEPSELDDPDALGGRYIESVIQRTKGDRTMLALPSSLNRESSLCVVLVVVEPCTLKAIAWVA